MKKLAKFIIGFFVSILMFIILSVTVSWLGFKYLKNYVVENNLIPELFSNQYEAILALPKNEIYDILTENGVEIGDELSQYITEENIDKYLSEEEIQAILESEDISALLESDQVKEILESEEVSKALEDGLNAIQNGDIEIPPEMKEKFEEGMKEVLKDFLNQSWKQDNVNSTEIEGE